MALSFCGESRVDQNRIYAPYMTVYLVISLSNIPFMHCMHMILTNPRCEQKHFSKPKGVLCLLTHWVPFNACDTFQCLRFFYFWLTSFIHKRSHSHAMCTSRTSRTVHLTHCATWHTLSRTVQPLRANWHSQNRHSEIDTHILTLTLTHCATPTSKLTLTNWHPQTDTHILTRTLTQCTTPASKSQPSMSPSLLSRLHTSYFSS